MVTPSRHRSASFRAAAWLGAAALVAGGASAATKRVFLTSTTCNGLLGACTAEEDDQGVAAANNLCQARAAAAGLTAGGAVFRAWLSDEETDAFCNVLGVHGQRADGIPCAGEPYPLDAGPWERLDGTPFAYRIDDLILFDERPIVPISIDEFGAPVPAGPYISGSTFVGAYLESASCSNWTVGTNASSAAGGIPLVSSYDWISGGSSGCGEPSRLVCLEVGAGDPFAYPSVPGALVFVTSTGFTGKLELWADAGGAAGIAAGDAVCVARATAAFLPVPGSFVAWLSDDSTDAIDRLTTEGPRERIDGIPVAASLADLTDGTLAATILADEWGQLVEGEVWTGTDDSGTASDLNCSNWTFGAGGDGAYAGVTWHAGSPWTVGLRDCSFSSRLYCFSNVIVIGWDNFEIGDFRRWSGAVTAP
jgi:hypothetical protein